MLQVPKIQKSTLAVNECNEKKVSRISKKERNTFFVIPQEYKK